LIDVSHQAQIQFSALRFDRATRAYFYEVQITNRSDEPLVAPLELDIDGVVIRRASRRSHAGRRARPIFVPLDASANILATGELEPGSETSGRVELPRRARSIAALARRGTSSVQATLFGAPNNGLSVFVPLANTIGLVEGASPQLVRFSVLIENGFGADVALEQLEPPGPEIVLNDRGDDGDATADDGAFSGTTTLDYSGISGGQCLTFVARAENGAGVKRSDP
jgi:hypothetical protein